MPASSAWPARLALAFLLLVLSGASVLLWRQIEAVQQQRVDERIGYQARSLARQLETILHGEVEGLGRIARLWNNLGRLQREDWEQDIVDETLATCSRVGATCTLNAATGNITNLTSTTATIGIIGAGTIVNAGSLTTGTLSTVGNAAIGGDLAVTGTTTMADMLTANGGINSGTVNINNVASGANNIANVNTLGARQGNFGNTSGTAGVVNVRNGAVDSITLIGQLAH